jgi:serine protease Do
VQKVNSELNGGLMVTDIQSEGLAARSGIQRGDVLIGLHLWQTASLDNVLFVINHPDAASFGPIKFWIIRGGEMQQGKLQ